MKNSIKFALAISVFFTSCQEEKMVSPDESTDVMVHQTDANARTSDLVPLEKYQLKQHGQDYVTYSAEGRLETVTNSYGPQHTYLIQYKYKGTRSTTEIEITATVYDNGDLNKKCNEAVYLVDQNTGRCFQSTHQAFAIPGYINQPKDLSPKTWRYIYNANGQLEKRYNKNNLNEWFKYDYVNGDLARATTYNINGNKVREIWFNYTQPSGQALKKNLYPLYIEAADLPDRYLKVFGKSSEHLLTSVSKKYVPLAPLDWPYEHNYTYTYNADGYVTGESKIMPGETELFEYAIFEYKTK